MKEKIACILKECRKKNKFSVDYVANELKSQGFEIAPKTLYGYETGKNQPNADIFLCLCKIYNITSFDMFFDEVNTEYTNKSYRELNDIGKQKADEYIEDLKANPKYTQKESKSIETQFLILIPLFLYQLIQRLRPIKIKIRQWTNRNYVYELWLVRKNK